MVNIKFQYIKNKQHVVFENKEEFNEYWKNQGQKTPEIIENWRHGKARDWIQADDGGIVQIIYQKKLPHPNDRKNYKNHRGYCRTVVGTFMQDDKVKMDTDFEKHPNRYRFGSATETEIHYRQKNRKNLSNPEVIFVTALCSGKDLQHAYEEYCTAVGLSFPHNNWQRKAIGILKRERIMNAINKNVEEIAQKLGIDYEYILSALKELGEKSKNDNIKLGVLRELADWLGGKEKMKQITSGKIHVFEPFGDREIARIEAERIEALDAISMEEIDDSTNTEVDDLNESSRRPVRQEEK